MTLFLRKLWSQEQGQDIAEYAVMLAVILVLVVGTIRLIGGSANNVFSQTASSIQQWRFTVLWPMKKARPVHHRSRCFASQTRFDEIGKLKVDRMFEHPIPTSPHARLQRVSSRGHGRKSPVAQASGILSSCCSLILCELPDATRKRNDVPVILASELLPGDI
jgi:Flp pilus assembly pilin Flp